MKCVREEIKGRVLHHLEWHSKNGPHDKNSWEIHFEHPCALGAAVTYLMLDYEGRKLLKAVAAPDEHPKEPEKQGDTTDTKRTSPPPYTAGRPNCAAVSSFHRTHDGENPKKRIR